MAAAVAGTPAQIAGYIISDCRHTPVPVTAYLVIFFKQRIEDGDDDMNQDQAGGKWKQFKGKVKEKWGKLTDDDLQMVEGKQDQLIGRLQERYGIAREEAERQVRDFQSANRDSPGSNDRSFHSFLT